MTASRDISSNGYFNWTIDIDDKSLSETKQFGFTFIPTGHAYSIKGPRMYSPGINVYPENPATTSGSSSPTSTSESSSTSTATSSDTKATDTATDTTTSNSASSGTSGLSPGAKAGIGVGVSVAGLAVLTLVAFLILRRRRQSSMQQGQTTKFSELGGGATVVSGGGYQHPGHHPGSNSSPVELASTVDGK